MANVRSYSHLMGKDISSIHVRREIESEKTAFTAHLAYLESIFQNKRTEEEQQK